MIRVLLAEDQVMVRGAIAALLQMEGDIDVVAQAGTGRTAIDQAMATRPDIALLDIEMPDMDGLSAAGILHRDLPGCGIVILTTFARPGYLKTAINNGVFGFLTKDAPIGDLAAAIRKVNSGLRVIDPLLALDALSTGDSPLTNRERDVLSVSNSGANIARIAKTLNLSTGTVRNYLSTAIQKLGGTNRFEAARIAESKGWL